MQSITLIWVRTYVHVYIVYITNVCAWSWRMLYLRKGTPRCTYVHTWICPASSGEKNTGTKEEKVNNLVRSFQWSQSSSIYLETPHKHPYIDSCDKIRKIFPLSYYIIYYSNKFSIFDDFISRFDGVIVRAFVEQLVQPHLENSTRVMLQRSFASCKHVVKISVIDNPFSFLLSPPPSPIYPPDS